MNNEASISARLDWRIGDATVMEAPPQSPRRSPALSIASAGVMPNSDPCQIITPLVLVGLGLGVGEGLGLGVGEGLGLGVGEGLGLGVGEGLGLGNHIAFSMRGVIIWQGVENGHNNGSDHTCLLFLF